MSDDDAKKFVKKLAEFYYQWEKFDQAEIWCRLLLQQNERSLGKLHETTLKSASELADVLYQQDKTIESGSMYVEIIERSRSLLGDNHSSTIKAFQGYSEVLATQGKPFGALHWQQKAVQGRLRTLGDENLETWTSIEHLAARLTNLNRYPEAEALYLQALPNIEQSCGIQSRYFLDVARDFGTMFERRHDFAQAEEWYQHVVIGCEIASGLRDKSTNLYEQWITLLEFSTESANTLTLKSSVGIMVCEGSIFGEG
tara:strand:- start:565 stop:1332 length:768 start_codon:yes stop_codon:yes gene_type:complete